MSKYDKLKNDELKKLLTERGLPTTGKKADLIARLTEVDQATTSAPKEAEPPTKTAAAASKPASVEAQPPQVAETSTQASSTPAKTKETAHDDREAKLAARAARFGIPKDEELEKKKAREARFGTATQKSVVVPEDTALSQPKAKQQSAPVKTKKSNAAPGEKRKSSILDDPIEAEKAKKRALKFGTASVAIPAPSKDLPPSPEVIGS